MLWDSLGGRIKRAQLAKDRTTQGAGKSTKLSGMPPA
jgi:hypothetical protein